MFKHILVPIDGSTHARRAVEYGADLAAKYDATLHLLHVITNVASSRVPEELREYADLEHVEISERDMLLDVATKLVEAARERARECGIDNANASIDTGNPASVIVRYCSANDIDLVVMGRRGLGDLGGLMLGSVSHKVAHLCDCPCMTVS
jgi:nucleotide-binding universal stress UspA family protein